MRLFGGNSSPGEPLRELLWVSRCLGWRGGSASQQCPRFGSSQPAVHVLHCKHIPMLLVYRRSCLGCRYQLVPAGKLACKETPWSSRNGHMHSQNLSYMWAKQDKDDVQGAGESDSEFKCMETALLSLWTLFTPAGEPYAGLHVEEDLSLIWFYPPLTLTSSLSVYSSSFLWQLALVISMCTVNSFPCFEVQLKGGHLDDTQPHTSLSSVLHSTRVLLHSWDSVDYPVMHLCHPL